MKDEQRAHLQRMCILHRSTSSFLLIVPIIRVQPVEYQ